MSDITVRRRNLHSENRSWLLGPDGTRPGDNPNVTLDVGMFTEATHYPNGFVPSGIVLGKITATQKFGPYDPAASDGREVAAGHLFSSLTVGDGSTVLGGALLHKGEVNPAKLPLQSGTGALTDAARLHLFRVNYSDKATIIPKGE